MSKDRLYLWCDTETTGLDHKTNHLLEVAFILTKPDLTEVSRFQSIIRPLGSDWLYYMNEFVMDMHLSNGLIEEILRLEGEEKHLKESIKVDSKAMNWLVESALGWKPNWFQDYERVNEEFPNVFLAGSTVEFDAQVLQRFMPGTFKQLHYRLINVSSIKEALLDLRPSVVHEYRNSVPKDKAHRAMTDIEVSIAEYRHYIERGALGGSNE